MTNTIRVLLVDDEPAVANLGATQLETVGDAISVTTETAARDALDRLRNAAERVDCVVSDYEMPEMDGLAFFDAVQEIAPDRPFILFTGKGSEEIASEAISAGVTDYLQKDTGTDQYEVLANRIRNAVSRRRAEVQATELDRINTLIRDVQKGLVQASTREEVEEVVCRRLTRSDLYLFAWVGTPDPETGAVVPRARAGDAAGYLESVDLQYDEASTDRDPVGRAVRTHETQVVQCLREEPTAEFDDAVEQFGCRSLIAVPVASDGDRSGVLAVYSDRPDAFEEVEREVLTELGDTVAQAIDAAETRRKLGEHERGPSFFKHLVEETGVGVSVYGDDGRITYANRACASLIGVERAEMAGTAIWELNPAFERARFDDYWNSFEAGETRRACPTCDRVDGHEVPVETVTTRVEIDGDAYHVCTVKDITERKRREEELRRSKRHFASVLRDPDSFIGLLHPDGTVARINRTALDFVDATSDDVEGEPFWETPWWTHSSDLQRELESRIADAADGEFVRFEAVNTDADGERVTLDTSLRPVTDGDDEVVAIVAEGRDITERKRVESELQEAKRKIEALHDTAAAVASCSTEEDVYDLAVEAAEDVLEFDMCIVDSAEDGYLTTRATSEGMPSEGMATMPVEEGIAGKVYRTGESSLDADVRNADEADPQGPYRSGITVPIGEFGVFQAVSEEIGFFDGSDLELAELLANHLTQALARIQSERELRAERDRFAAIFANIPNPALSYVYEDDEPIIRDVNPAFEDVFGWSAERIVDESIDSFIVPSEKAEEARALNERVQDERLIEGAELRRKTSDGVRDFLLTTVPVAVEGDIEGFSIYTDITEQKQRERELQTQNERLEEFASVISHDLRNPLNVAQGRHQLLAEESDSEHLQPLGDALTRMDALIEDLLSLAQQGRGVRDTESVSVERVARDAWETVDTSTAGLVVADGLGTVDADAGRLRELFENLFRNAVEHGSTSNRTESGDVHQTSSDVAHQNPSDSEDAVVHGSTSSEPSAHDAVEHVSPDVTVAVESLPGAAGFCVVDDGDGIPDEASDQLFEHGYSTAADGTGFGLPIVESICEAHGWEITATDAEDGGARFEIRLT